MLRRLILAIGICGIFFWPMHIIAQTSVTNITDAESRLQKAVLDNSISLDLSQKILLISRCVNAQDLLIKVQQDSKKLIEKRITTYTSIQKELQAIKLRMIRQGADASETDLLTGKIQQAMDDFKLQADAYDLSMSDIININCQQYPEYFKAGLVVMRIKRSLLLNSSIKLKSVVADSDDDIFFHLKRRLVI